MNRILLHNAIDPWPLEDKSVQCIVTSPPYWNLRDYGIEGQLGLEKTPEEYIANMIKVFREAWRVLKDDGTLWINVGCSYASHDIHPSLSLSLRRVLPHDKSYKGLRGSVGFDFSCSCQCDEPLAYEMIHRGRICNTCQTNGQFLSPFLETGRDISHLDSSSKIDPSETLADHHSTNFSLKESDRGVSSPLNSALSCPSKCEKVPFCGIRSFHTVCCTCGKSMILQTSFPDKEGIEFFYSACNREDCKGVGKCGYCYCKLSISTIHFKKKDLINTPFLLAQALQADGWYFRSDIVWAKRNCMPESVTDRPTRSHEALLLFSKSEAYYYDHEAIKEPAIYDVDGTGTAARKARQKSGNKSLPLGINAGIRPAEGKTASAGFKNPAAFDGKNGRKDKQRGHSRRHAGFNDRWDHMTTREQCTGMRNKRDVWHIATAQFPGAHYAVMPELLALPCVLAGSRPGDIILDPFAGTGTSCLVAGKNGRKYIGFELNPESIRMADERLEDLGMFK